MNYSVKQRFLRYVQIDTQADPYSETTPSTMKQLDLSRVLSEELTAMGITHEMTESGHIHARIPSNSAKQNVPSIFFCSHVDTAYDCSGTNVKPIVHSNYQGGDIVLPDDEDQVITMEKFPELKDKIGEDIITASGLTLLGADDKSGVACIMDAAYQLISNPEIEHGDVVLFFTVDEEIGRGVVSADLSKIKADYGYTLDSGNLGNLEYENFSANSFKLSIEGVSAHPGYAKGKMEHAIKIAADIVSALPKDSLSPETTSAKQGFIHPTNISGGLEKAEVNFIIRDFDTSQLDNHQEVIINTANTILKDYPNSSFTTEVKEQYRNMGDVISNSMGIVDTAIQAMKNVGITPNIGSIRGGTDGAILSHKGLPCPNLFSGQHGIHSKLEWTTVQEMQKAVDTVIEICRLTEANA